jgi:hypothetical protein
LVEALGELGLSPHNTIAVGDAENDHSLLEVAEIGVAVANAVESLRHHADVVLDLPDGAGVAELVRGPLVSGRSGLQRPGREIRVELGGYDARPTCHGRSLGRRDTDALLRAVSS